jgi:PAS domain S-box-containing protein
LVESNPIRFHLELFYVRCKKCTVSGFSRFRLKERFAVSRHFMALTLLWLVVSVLTGLTVHRLVPGTAAAAAVFLVFLSLAVATYSAFRWMLQDVEHGFGMEWGRREHAVHLERDALRLDLEQARLNISELEAKLQDATLQTARLHSVFTQLCHPVVFLDLKGSILDLNTSAVNLFGDSARRLRGKPLYRLPAFAKAEALPALFERAAAQDGKPVQFQQELFGQQGESNTLILTLTGVFGESGRAELIILEGQDVTERLRAEAALQETFQQFQQSQKMEAIGRLAGGIAHDFNNLLTSILGFTHMALEEIPEGLEAVEDLNEVVLAATRAQNLTQKLLAISRKELFNSRPVDLNQLVRDMHKLIRVTLHENIEIVTDLCPEYCTILADVTSLEQVVLNLAVNARDAMPRSGRLYIRTEIRELENTTGILPEPKPGKYVVFSLRDTGCGMGPDVLEHIFEPFFTTKEAGQGTGLGLSTVYAIMKQYTGGIHISSEPGVGTDFKLYFPYYECAEQMMLELPREEKPPPEKGVETILLVEDEDGVRRMASKMIESLGYTLLAAANGEEGLRVAEAYDGTIDLIITDVVMPNLSGPEMIDQLRLSLGYIPHLYVSGFTMDKLVEHGADDSAENLIRKPYSRDELARRIRETLNEA